MNNNLTRGSGWLENFLAKKRAKMADKLIPNGLRGGCLLDLGCGSVPFFLLNVEFNKKYGIELSPKGNKDIKDIIIKSFNIENPEGLPFNDDFFDVVTMLAVVEHIRPDRLPLLLKEIRRILKTNGRFVVTTPCPWSDKLLKIMSKLGLASAEEINEHKGSYGRKLIIQQFESAGFKKGIKLKMLTSQPIAQ